jgi:hypothetical protein
MIVKDTLEKPSLSSSDSLRSKELRDEIDRKFEKWQKINIYNGFFEALSGALVEMGRAADTSSTRSAFFNWLDSNEVFNAGVTNRDAFVNAACRFYKVDRKELITANKEGFELFNRMFRVAAYTLETYKNRVLMPGMIIRTNATATNGNLVTWNFKIETFYATDYTMFVESRVVNKIAVVVSALLLIIFVGFGLLRMARTK